MFGVRYEDNIKVNIRYVRCDARQCGQEQTDSVYFQLALFYKDGDQHSGSIIDENFQRLNNY